VKEGCLVTGGAGFIGSHLVEALVALGKRVRVLDIFSTGLAENLTGLEADIEIVNADVVDADAVHQAMKDVGLVFHLAALPSVQRSVENPLATHHATATGTLHVLDAARQAGVRRVIYASSSSIYGGLLAEAGQSEVAPVAPKSPYAAAKLAGEFYAQAFATSYGLETVCLRLFNVFGPRQRADSAYAGAIPRFCSAMLHGESPLIYGDGLQSRDFTFVANVVSAFLLAAEAHAVSGKIYNVGTGRGVSLRDLINALNRLLGTQIEPRYLPERSGDVRSSLADIRRACRDLHYFPAISFEQGLEKTVEWHQNLCASR
jgi:UDP-glucose 4-epimerase